MLRLKELRQEKKLTQVEIAKIFNLTQGTYSNYENETTQPDMKILIEMADHFDVSLDYLVGRSFVNDVGYLTKDEKEILTVYREMTEDNKQIYYQEGRGILLAQGLKN